MKEINLTRLWNGLSVESANDSERLIRNIGDSILISWNTQTETREVLIKLQSKWPQSSLPRWNGMTIEVVEIELLRKDEYLVLGLLDQDLYDIFVIFCMDALRSIDGVNENLRPEILNDLINRWGRFFSRGRRILSEPRQRGLFSELWWMRNMILGGQPASEAVSSWLGPERGYHDFEDESRVVEVKSTIMKEPRKVTINNERQLDDQGIEKLLLFVLTLNLQKNGESLPELIQEIRSMMGDSQSLKSLLQIKLCHVGYLDSDSKRYPLKYKVRKEELFRVREGFPRIIRVGDGIGDIKYSVQVSSMREFEISPEEI